MSIRKIIEINEELCTGCGQCVLDCAEGAIQIVNGKAKVMTDSLCDGLGACIGGCPEGALRIIEREAAPFDEEAVHTHLARQKKAAAPTLPCGCPGSLAQQLGPLGSAPATGGCPSARAAQSSAGHWPVKLRLMPETAAFLRGADLLLAADCAPVVCPDFQTLRQGKVTLLSCPKFEDTESLAQKLMQICRQHAPRSITVVRMEVPCCATLARWVDTAVDQSGQSIPVQHICLGRDGRPVGTD